MSVAGPPRAPRWAPLLLVPGGLALLAGLDAALTLAGVPAPAGSPRLALLHGPLMVLGFLGTVIALERAVALRAAWGLLAPGMLGAGALALVVLPDPLLGRLLMVQGLVLLVVVYGALGRRNGDPLVGVQALGAVLAACAALLLTRLEVAAVVPLLVAFVVLTIAAERVELARLAMPTGAHRALTAFAAVLTGTALAALLWPSLGGRAQGVVLVALTLWLLQHDVARRLVRSTGLPRFAAAALLLGYGWLLVAGLGLAVLGSPDPTTAGYDVVVHATFLGFAMSMILAHAPVILPAVLRARLPYSTPMWVPLAALHTSLLARVVTVLRDASDGWQVALVANVAAVLLFLLVTVGTAVAARRRPERAPHTPPAAMAAVPRPTAPEEHA
ncbi:hypothetical protein GCM10009584_30170 [Ornithinimicrobium humiphilum]|uniref:NnrS protein n=1 Tax=Ornithinimicrobium humiphilum TaxID=125288 RepID=A0A543K6Q5_9MICO|nr:hypothetical protein [Ornithinimicrobium humiphilum]TQM90745.1 hypothetical protein FB476_3128 [Ornithinimicrobium humiphilum]